MAATCIDLHTHIVPEQFPKYAGRGANVPWPSMADAHACHKHVMISGKVYRTVSDGSWSVPRRIEAMAAMRVARQVISPMPELLSVLAAARGCASIDPLPERPDRGDGGACARAADRPGRGAAAGRRSRDPRARVCDRNAALSGRRDREPRQRRLDRRSALRAVLRGGQEAGAAVFVHALRPAGQERIVGTFPEQAVCFPGDIALAAASMITGGMAARHPELRIAFSHGGGGLSLLLPRLDHAWKNVPKAKESLAESPIAYARRFYYDALVFSPQAVRFLADTYGVSQLIIGSDYPYAMGDPDPLATLTQAGFGPDIVTAITSGNAKRFLKLGA
jgi:aminocarboxymuconate-semialdehyde decarboxylase